MAGENVRLTKSNFCLLPLTDLFGSLNDSTSTFTIYNSNGVLQREYSLSNTVSEIQAIEYVGPRNLSLSYTQLGTIMPIFTLERLSSSSCSIKKWRMDSVSSNLNLEDTFNFSSAGSNYFNCYAMAVENTQTTFAQTTTTGTGKIKLSSVGNIDTGDILLLGPSTDVDNMHAFEEVSVDSIDGDWVFISTSVSGTVAPVNEYQVTDKITHYKDIYLFSDIGQDNDSYKGSMYRINSVSGTVLDVKNSGIYSGVRAASWSRDYSLPGFVKDINIFYFNVATDQIQRSQVMTNTESDRSTLIQVYDILFDNTDIYRLQRKTTTSDDSGAKSTESWATYNYQIDSIVPYARTIDINTHPDGIILNDDNMVLKAVVRDQFGVTLSSRNVKFYDNPDNGYFTPLNGEVVTNSLGVATILYNTNYYDPLAGDQDVVELTISARSDGSSAAAFGSQYIWDAFILDFHKRLKIESSLVEQLNNEFDVENEALIKQLPYMETDFSIKGLSKFQFPGGDWYCPFNDPYAHRAPDNNTAIIKQLRRLTSPSDSQASMVLFAKQIDNVFDMDSEIKQDKDKSDDMMLSQLYTSRHELTGHKDTASINQFRFIVDAIPAFWSEKNSVDTSIWVRLRPFAFSLNQSTLIFKIREVYYGGDSGYVDITSLCSVFTFDAGGGLLGLDITYQHPVHFHHGSVIYVSIEVYDTAPTPNVVFTDYWFKVIPDYRAPYIENEVPGREEEDVEIQTNIEFDIFDAGTGVDISTLQIYLNNRYVIPGTSIISGGYHVFYDPTEDFFYGERVEIFVYVRDIMGNLLHDAWRFYCVGSPGPWIDRSSFYPRSCSKGIYRKLTGISANIYGIEGTGVDPESIIVHIGGKKRDIIITPIIYRLD
jgi:hypothetical protein